MCSASATPEEAARKRERFPGAVAEDMEGFGVALACHLTGTPLRILRGISNLAGDRDHGNWRSAPALDGVREHARRVLTAESWP